MTTWLESTNVHQDGTPVTRKIKIPEMGEEIWFTDNAYAEVSDDVGDILANNIDSISKLGSAPSSPGTYYGDANSNTTVQINISDGVFDALTAESIASDAIDTGHTVSNAISGSSVTPRNETLQAQRRQWSWTDLNWEDKGEAIQTPSGTNSADGCFYPVHVHAAEVFDNPIDDHYLYWSGHDTPSGIELSTAPDPWGPWSYYGTVMDPDNYSLGGHIASPSGAVDPENGRYNLYVHTPDDGQQTYLSTTSLTGDGTNFSIETKVLNCPFDNTWNEQERSYLTVERVGQKWIGVFQGRDRSNNAPGIGVAKSLDGENWTVEPSPAFDNTQWQSYDPRSYNGGSPALSTIGGVPEIHYGDRPNAVVLPYADRDKPAFGGGEIVYEIPSWSSYTTGVNVYDWYNDGKYLYMYYYVSGSGGSGAMGVARTDLEVIYQ